LVTEEQSAVQKQLLMLPW